jgi:hypothetical protein
LGRAAPHGGRRDRLEISPNWWADVDLVRGGGGMALAGAARLQEDVDAGAGLSVELVFPLSPGKAA